MNTLNKEEVETAITNSEQLLKKPCLNLISILIIPHLLFNLMGNFFILSSKF